MQRLSTCRFLLASLVPLALVACGSQELGQDGEGASAIFAGPTTADPGNPWMKGVDPVSLAVGEEVRLPDEDAMFEGFARDVNDMQTRLRKVNGGVTARGFHAKGHACVLGELRISPSQEVSSSRVGLFAKRATYPTWIRFSNGTGFVQADRKGDVRGVALKVMNVNGARAIADGATTQDFLMTNGAATPAPDAARFVAFGKALTDARVDSNGDDVGIIERLLKVGGFLSNTENRRVRNFLIGSALPRVISRGSMLGEQFWTGGAFALGLESGDPMTSRARQAAKMTAIAGVWRNEKCTPVRDLPNVSDADYFRTDLVERLARGETCLEIKVQLQRNPAVQLIEDTSVEWKEEDAPFISVGTVVMPKVDLTGPEAQTREAECNGYAFTPWHTLAAHRPLGNIMRARLKVYNASSEAREAAPEPAAAPR